MSVAQDVLPESISRLLVASGPVGAEMHPPEPEARQDVISPSSTRDVDRAFRSGIARVTGGLPPSALAGAYLDWAVHLAASPGKQSRARRASRHCRRGEHGVRLGCAGGSARDPVVAHCRRTTAFAPAIGSAFRSTCTRMLSCRSNAGGSGDHRHRGVSKQHESAVTSPRGRSSTPPRLRTSSGPIRRCSIGRGRKAG